LTDWCELVMPVKSTEEFTKSLLVELLLLPCHSFIHSFQHSKQCSSNNWNVIYDQVNLWFSCDFTEYEYYYFARVSLDMQVTIHQFVIYFKKFDALNTEHENLVKYHIV
jgi:hypothetical protein